MATYDRILFMFLKALNLPYPQPEYKFHPYRRWRFDYAWIDRKVALEIEGGVWTQGRHNRAKGFIGDMEKYNAAMILGWKVLRVLPTQVVSGEAVKLLRPLLEVGIDG